MCSGYVAERMRLQIQLAENIFFRDRMSSLGIPDDLRVGLLLLHIKGSQLKETKKKDQDTLGDLCSSAGVGEL